MDRPTLHVLLLEDQLDWAAFLRRLLDAVEDVRFVLTHAASLAELCAKLERGTFDAILLDLCVEDSEGLDTFRRAKAAAPDVPIVVQSGLQGSDVAVAAVGLGAQDYILKDEVTARSLSRALLYAVERRRYQEALRVSEERYSLAMRAANAGLWDWDMKKGELHVSARWLTQLGLDGEDGRTLGPDVWATALVEEDRAAFGEAIKAHLEGRTDHFEVEYRIHTAAGTRWCLCRGLAMRDASGQPTRMAGSQSDITRQKRAEERLRHDALHDALTGLPNRTLFRDRLEHALHRIRRDPRKGFAVLFVDLDRFKMVNDSLGHAAGDELLRGVARRLTGLLRPGDTVARLGGDEFAVLLEDASATHDAEITAERLVEALSRPFDVESGEVIVGASVGISHSHAAYLRPEEMLRNADTALYHAKRRGGGHISMFEPQLHAQASERLSLEMDLRRALENDELLLSFQPIVSLADQEIQGFEALLRWNSPTRGMVRPDAFIPLAEDTGLIVRIGDWVLREACTCMKHMIDGHLRGRVVPVSVNLSPRQLREAAFVGRVRDILEETGLPPEALTLEITENALMDNPSRVAAMLQELRGMGISIDIDDFGTGWSSLGYLRDLPVDRLKIDRSFVEGIGRDNGDFEIVRAILDLARNLRIGVVAEGIETVEQLASLKGLSCDFGQGFLFARPGPMQGGLLAFP